MTEANILQFYFISFGAKWPSSIVNTVLLMSVSGCKPATTRFNRYYYQECPSTRLHRGAPIVLVYLVANLQQHVLIGISISSAPPRGSTGVLIVHIMLSGVPPESRLGFARLRGRRLFSLWMCARENMIRIFDGIEGCILGSFSEKGPKE